MLLKFGKFLVNAWSDFPLPLVSHLLSSCPVCFSSQTLSFHPRNKHLDLFVFPVPSPVCGVCITVFSALLLILLPVNFGVCILSDSPSLWVMYSCGFGCLLTFPCGFYITQCWMSCVPLNLLQLCSHLQVSNLEMLGLSRFDLRFLGAGLTAFNLGVM